MVYTPLNGAGSATASPADLLTPLIRNDQNGTPTLDTPSSDADRTPTPPNSVQRPIETTRPIPTPTTLERAIYTPPAPVGDGDASSIFESPAADGSVDVRADD
jgi:hypothetical protein